MTSISMDPPCADPGMRRRAASPLSGLLTGVWLSFLMGLWPYGPAVAEPAPGPAPSSTSTFEFGDFALYVAEETPTIRAVLLALGGPDTRGFITGGPFGAPNPELEASLHLLGGDLRRLAREERFALLGTGHYGARALVDHPASDELLLSAITEGARVSGRHELHDAPLLIYGISGGSPQADGFALRHPERVAALLLKTPLNPRHRSSPEALAVPTYLILAEQDDYTDNHAIADVFKANRRAGGLWAVAVEPGIGHHTLTPAQRRLKVNWLGAIASLRVDAARAMTPLPVPASAGWLAEPGLGVAAWESFEGNRGTASWFPSKATAEDWQAFIRGNGSP